MTLFTGGPVSLPTFDVIPRRRYGEPGWLMVGLAHSKARGALRRADRANRRALREHRRTGFVRLATAARLGALNEEATGLFVRAIRLERLQSLIDDSRVDNAPTVG